MNKKKIAQDNAMFFIAVVGMSLGMEYFAQAVLDSSLEMSQFPTDLVGSPGYIKIDSSVVRKEREKCWNVFVEKIRCGLLQRASYEFSSATKFKGELKERVTFKKEGYIFSFRIEQYERGADRNFQIIGPEDLNGIADDEQLGRVVYLTIKPKEGK